MGAVFGGGSSETVFGSSGAGNFLTKLTTGIAILFMLTSLVMTYGLARQTSQSLFDDVPAPAVPQEATDGIPSADTAEGQVSDAQSAGTRSGSYLRIDSTGGIRQRRAAGRSTSGNIE